MPSLLSPLHDRLTRIRTDFRRLWRNYIYQTLLAMAAVIIVLWLLELLNAVVIASIGATAFIVFTAPGSPPASAAALGSAVLTAAVAFSLAQRVLGKRLKDLM